MKTIITVTPATQSGFRFEHLAKKEIAAQPHALAGAYAHAMDRTVEQMRQSGRDFKEYTYIVTFEVEP